MSSNIDAARDRYHFAKLALFNMRLLHRLQKQESSAISELIASEAKENGFSDTPPLLHQGAFLEFAYVCLVWLWESAKQAQLVEVLLSEFPSTAQRLELNLPSEDQIEGERALKDWRSVLRLLRNALSHGRVEVTEVCFIFSDHDTYRKPPESAPTRLQLSWEQLAKISESCLHSLTPALWPTTA